MKKVATQVFGCQYPVSMAKSGYGFGRTAGKNRCRYEYETFPAEYGTICFRLAVGMNMDVERALELVIVEAEEECHNNHDRTVNSKAELDIERSEDVGRFLTRIGQGAPVSIRGVVRSRFSDYVSVPFDPP